MRTLAPSLASHSQVVESKWRSGSSRKVCKTFIHRFDSDPRLQPKSSQNQAVSSVESLFSGTLESLTKPSKKANVRRIALQSLAQSLAGSLARFFYIARQYAPLSPIEVKLRNQVLALRPWLWSLPKRLREELDRLAHCVMDRYRVDRRRVVAVPSPDVDRNQHLSILGGGVR